ncbi:hypothetical protein [Adhaeribacter radiodurans]|uniref:Uncharacterized protein n=1 Tax=Adhaeribacter radiodurans TaxID=2745197 RepID=A0A7L7LDU5_9BACT|nr:hypothetical protein [Adhaeribacter radiodurans]QMU30953.1 hypothetical protein HUW48_24305 [Adhaeribacter radiodurans]
MLLLYAGLIEEQHGGISRGYFLSQGYCFPEGRRLPDYIPEGIIIK